MSINVPEKAENVEDIPSENTYDAPFSVNISFPESIVIKMVDASALNDYEILIFLSGLSCNFFSGFLVAALTVSKDSQFYGIASAACAALTGTFIGWAISKRRTMTKKSKSFKLKAGNVVELKKPG